MAHPAAAALPQAPWAARPEVALALAAAAGIYAAGWWRLARRGAPASPARVAAALAGLAAAGAALLSPLDALAHRSFAAHMLQHMLLVAVAAPALLLADPFPVVLWGLPSGARRLAGRWLARPAPLRRLLACATAMPVAFALHAAVVWSWHLPAAYDGALADRLVHDVEHAAFLAAALLFWWPVIHPAPRLRAPGAHAARIVYLVLGAFQTAALGLLLTVAPVVIYRTYAAAAGAAALDDQALGGVVMWGLGGVVDMVAVLALLYRSLGSGSRPAIRGAVPGTVSAPGM